MHQSVLAEQPRDRAPLKWAAAMSNLGIALRLIGEREDDTAMLQAAVSAHRGALVEFRRERSEYQWARTQCYLGLDLLHLGEREVGTGHLEEANAAFEACLPILAPESSEPLMREADQGRAFVQSELERRRMLHP